MIFENFIKELKNNVVITCYTQEQCVKLFDILSKYGFLWANENVPNETNTRFNEKIGSIDYFLDILDGDKVITYSAPTNPNYFKKWGTPIYDFVYFEEK